MVAAGSRSIAETLSPLSLKLEVLGLMKSSEVINWVFISTPPSACRGSSNLTPDWWNAFLRRVFVRNVDSGVSGEALVAGE